MEGGVCDEDTPVSRLGNVVYMAFVLGIILPFQLAIIPLFVAIRDLGLVGNYLGMIVLNIGLLMPLTVFLPPVAPRTSASSRSSDGKTAA